MTKKRKIAFDIPESDFTDFAVLASIQPGAPSPGQYAKALVLAVTPKGRKIRQKYEDGLRRKN